ncbi:MAG: substrate-binding domain-containing protein [Caldilineaceae bacterium]
MAQGVEEEATRHGYSIFLASTATDPEREVEVVRGLQGRQVDGIIVSSSSIGNRYADLLQDSGIPLVLVNTLVEGDNIHSIYHDDYQGARRLMTHLVDRGYRRIAYIGDGRGGRSNRARQQAWRDVLQEVGLPEQPAVVSPMGHLQGGVAANHVVDPSASRVTAILTLSSVIMM